MKHTLGTILFLLIMVGGCGTDTVKISSVHPVYGLTRGGQKATIYGNNLEVLSPITVYFGDRRATVTSLNKRNELWVNTPASPNTGLVDIRIIGAGGREFIIRNGFEYILKDEMAECINISRTLNEQPLFSPDTKE